jgi:tetratricopeptide (TPR) repeat protein
MADKNPTNGSAPEASAPKQNSEPEAALSPPDATVIEQLTAITAHLKGLTEAAGDRRRGRVRTFVDECGKLAENLFHIAIVLAVLMLVGYVATQAWKDSVEVEEFSVPKELEEAGYGPAVVAERVKQELQSIAQAVPEIDGPRFLLPSEDTTPDFEVPEMKLPVRSIVSFLRTLLGKTQTRIEGNIVKDGDNFWVTIRVRDKPELLAYHTKSFKVSGSDLRPLIRLSAETAMTFSDPFTMGKYFADQGDYYNAGKLASVIEASSTCSLPFHQAIGADLFGIALQNGILEPGRYPDPKTAYDRARKLYPGIGLIEVNAGLWSYAYASSETIKLNMDASSRFKKLGLADLNIAQEYGRQQNYDQEIEYCRKARSAKSADKGTQARALASWAEALANKGDLTGAQSKLQEAATISELGTIYLSWGDILSKRGDEDGASSMYEKACNARVPAVEGCFLRTAGLLTTGTPDQLFVLCRRAMMIKPGDSNVVLQIGAIEEHFGHDSHAEADYRAAMWLSPTEAKRNEPHKALYDLLIRRGMKREAAILGAPQESW